MSRLEYTTAGCYQFAHAYFVANSRVNPKFKRRAKLNVGYVYDRLDSSPSMHGWVQIDGLMIDVNPDAVPDNKFHVSIIKTITQEEWLRIVRVRPMSDVKVISVYKSVNYDALVKKAKKKKKDWTSIRLWFDMWTDFYNMSLQSGFVGI